LTTQSFYKDRTGASRLRIVETMAFSLWEYLKKQQVVSGDQSKHINFIIFQTGHPRKPTKTWKTPSLDLGESPVFLGLFLAQRCGKKKVDFCISSPPKNINI
jgi:hypothetical protein